ncbi:hypothetical protein H480_03021 [Amycolatopsis vancoresmycina DSM 44592]|uniref:Uncharacterized protein n=1 Tax=Amycolatopsis vancoresmycina DSM 44592 TaxID=1292037 RepID=R1IBZ6_9PSEU|nr:hypothetical protein [Amycolatopsis vancoresmycina]EOD70036.1 hypothetical protein H480_03021 [Amycolatopsis vancoresmycina DSM 44592]
MRTTRRYRTINIQASEHTLTAVDPLPDDLRDALTRIHDRGAHPFEPSQVNSRGEFWIGYKKIGYC